MVAADGMEATGSRWVMTKAASGKVAWSAGSCSMWWGHLMTQRFGPRNQVSTCSTFFR